MSYETILFEITDHVGRLTFNRPERLNSFTTAMHVEVRDAIDRLVPEGACTLVLRGAGRAFSAGQDLNDRAVAPGSRPVDLGQSIEKHYRPLMLFTAVPAAAGDRSRERCGRGSRRQHRARLRHRGRSPIGIVHPVVQQAGLVPDCAEPGRCRTWRAMRARWDWHCSATGCPPSKPRTGA